MSSDSNSFSAFESECLEAHNLHRARHGVPPLKLKRYLCAFSQERAETLVSIGEMEHRTDASYGENLYKDCSSDPNHEVSGRVAVDSWYGEIEKYAFGTEPSSNEAGHYTQVVWRNSTELGVGVARDSSGRVFVVCNYNPPGNCGGDYRNNVTAPM